MQRTEPNIINVVYSGDTDASKEQILAKVKVRLQSFVLGFPIDYDVAGQIRHQPLAIISPLCVLGEEVPC